MHVMWQPLSAFPAVLELRHVSYTFQEKRERAHVCALVCITRPRSGTHVGWGIRSDRNFQATPQEDYENDDDVDFYISDRLRLEGDGEERRSGKAVHESCGTQGHSLHQVNWEVKRETSMKVVGARERWFVWHGNFI